MKNEKLIMKNEKWEMKSIIKKNLQLTFSHS